MSAISLPTPVDLEVPIRPRPVAVGLPGNVLFPPVGAPPRSRVRARATNLFAAVLLNVMIFTTAGVATYVTSGFAGNVSLEAANRDAIRSTDRATSAHLAEGGLRRAVDVLNSDETVARWATFNHFVPPYKLSVAAKPSKK
ncbi:MAG TPA: hypothetical protein VKT78_19290 [Fimbriimonadaceae bacterium]|nr:hypothetical protein [Fimbriimonadaceae bacterium]